MRATFGFDKATSPVNKAVSMGVKTYPQAQYMALCQFTNVFWEFDTAHNHAPVLVFEGEIERLDAIETKFPHNIDAVYFTDHKPRIRYDYQFDRKQHEQLAAKGFWDENGVRIPELFTTSKFQLECDIVVDEITKAYETQKVPILNISVQHPYENTFCTDQYDIAEFITAAEPEESKSMQHIAVENVEEINIAAEVEAAKQAAAALAEAEKQAAYVPLTAEEMEIRRQSSNVDKFVNDIRERHRVERDEHNAIAEAEKARIKAEQEVLANKDKPVEKDKNLVEFDDTAISKTSGSAENLVETDDTNKFENNEAIFNDAVPAEEETLPDNVAALMSKLGWSDDKSDEQSDTIDDKKNDKKDDGTGSGAASGAQGLGVYTFEDQSTAQYEMRQDEGKGNEKEDTEDESEEKSNDDAEKKSDDKPDKPASTESDVDKHRREAQLTTAINDTTVSAANNRDRNDRSK